METFFKNPSVSALIGGFAGALFAFLLVQLNSSFTVEKI
jgi:hypothetical protein